MKLKRILIAVYDIFVVIYAAVMFMWMWLATAATFGFTGFFLGFLPCLFIACFFLDINGFDLYYRHKDEKNIHHWHS